MTDISRNIRRELHQLRRVAHVTLNKRVVKVDINNPDFSETDDINIEFTVFDTTAGLDAEASVLLTSVINANYKFDGIPNNIVATVVKQVRS